MQTLTWSPQLQHVVRDIKKLNAKQNESLFKDWKHYQLSQEERESVQAAYQNHQKSAEIDSTMGKWD